MAWSLRIQKIHGFTFHSSGLPRNSVFKKLFSRFFSQIHADLTYLWSPWSLKMQTFFFLLRRDPSGSSSQPLVSLLFSKAIAWGSGAVGSSPYSDSNCLNILDKLHILSWFPVFTSAKDTFQEPRSYNSVSVLD